MLFDADMNNRFWGEAVVTANFLQNRLPTRSTGVTPYERWNGYKPDLGGLHRFGAWCYALVPKENRRKLDDKAIKLRFVGYDENSKAFRLADEQTNKVVISRDVRFLRGDHTRPTDSGQSAMTVHLGDEKLDDAESADSEDYEIFDEPDVTSHELEGEGLNGTAD
jgi:hypothetical protein